MTPRDITYDRLEDEFDSDDDTAGLFSNPAAIAGRSGLLIGLLDELEAQRGRIRENDPDA
jgi:hypothetical protein